MPPVVPQPNPATIPAPQVAAPVVNKTIPAPVVETPQKETNAAEIIKRASAAPTEPARAEAPRVSVTVDDVQDPAARAVLEKKLAEANAAIAKTFGQIGADKDKYLQEVERLKGQLNQGWSPERLKGELQRNDFVQAAQALQAQAAPNGWEGTHEEWSALTPSEKTQFQTLVANQSTLTQQMAGMLQAQVDSQLKTKYPDYDPSSVDDFIRKASAGQIPADQIREFVHKAMNAERWVKQAYEFAMQDKTVALQEKINGSTQVGLNATFSADKPTRKEGEPTRSYISRLTNWNMDFIKKTVANQRT